MAPILPGARYSAWLGLEKKISSFTLANLPSATDEASESITRFTILILSGSVGASGETCLVGIRFFLELTGTYKNISYEPYKL